MHKHCASQKHSLDLCPCKHKELHTHGHLHGHIADTEFFLYYNYSSKKGTHGESNEPGQPNRVGELNQKGIREIQKSRY